MIDRQKLEAILVRRFPGASIEQIAAAANAIMALDVARPVQAKAGSEVASALPSRSV